MSDLEEKDTKRNVPKLRFPGFTDPWEQRKVRELLNERNERAPKSDEYPLMAFIANEGVAPKGERFDRSALINDTEGKLYKRTKYNDFIYSSNNLETGSIGLNKYGNACISPVYSIFETSDIADPDFIGRRFTCKDFIYKMVKSRQGVIYGQWRIHESDFLKIDIEVPGKVEQKAIGYFFNYFDNLITLRQRELDHVKLMKRGLLQKMFPKDGADTPEIRFPGFADPWEQRKLGDMVEFYQGQTYSPVDIADTDGILVLRSSNVQHGQVVSNDDVHIACTVKLADNVRRNDIIVVVRNGSRSLIGKHALIRRDMPNTVIGAFMVGVRSEEPFFANALFDTAAFDKEIEKNLGATINQITGYMFGRMSFLVPSISEQRVVGSFFNDLDNLIALRQRELDHVKLLKKSLLQQMFV